jgi:hypothetical protein
MGERTGDVTAGGDPSDPAAIERDIETTRAEMSETIGAIQERLDPEVVTEQAKDVARVASEEAKEVIQFAIDEAKGAVRELADQATTSVREATIGRVEKMTRQTRGTAGQVQGGLLETIRQNPVPAAMAAVGIGWLLSNRAGGSAGPRYDYASRQSGAWGGSGQGYDAGYGYGSGAAGVSGFSSWEEQGGSSVGQQAQQMAGQMQERAGEAGAQMQQMAGQMSDQFQDQAHQAQRQAQGLWQTIEANPVAAGALGLILGGIAGLLIPETEQEHKLLGESRDRVVGSLQEVAGQTVEKAQRVVGEAAQEAVKTAKDEAKAQGMMPKSGSGSAAGASSTA